VGAPSTRSLSSSVVTGTPSTTRSSPKAAPWSMMTRSASVSQPPSGSMRPCSPGSGRGGRSCGRPRSSTSVPANSSTSCQVATVSGRAPGSPPGRWSGGRASSGRHSICPGRIGRCSTRCCQTPPRTLIRSTSSSWLTPSSTRCAAGCRTRHSPSRPQDRPALPLPPAAHPR
jgi:hypothetical protein